MIFFIGYFITGLVIGFIARAIMTDDFRLTLAWAGFFGAVSGLFFGWFGLLLHWYELGSGLDLLTAVVGAAITMVVAYASQAKRVGS